MNKFIKIFYIIAILLTEISILKAQSVTWQKVLNYTDNSVLFKAHQTSDGGYIAVGNNGIGGFGKIILVKFNLYGDTLWNKYFDLSVNSVYSSLWIEETKDKGFIISGTGEGINSDAYLIKTDLSGNVQWYKTFGGDGLDQGVCVKQLPDNGFIFLVRTVSYSPTNDILLIKTDSIGNEIWRKIYGNNTYQERGYEVQLIGNSGYIIVGRKNISNNPTNLYLIRTDLYGDSLWTKTLSFYVNSTGFSIDITNENGFIIGGTADSTNNNYPLSYIVKTDSAGNIEWQKRYSSAFKEFCFSIRSLPNNCYAFCGMSDSTFFNYERAILRKIDKNGNIIYEKYFRGGIYENSFQSVELTNDQGFVLCGYADFGTAKSLIVRTDSLGNVISVGINNNNLELDKNFTLFQNYPNPFKSQTSINFNVFKPSFIEIKIFDVTGKLIKFYSNDQKSIGLHKLVFDPQLYNLSSGIYYYSFILKINNNLHTQVKTLKMLYLK